MKITLVAGARPNFMKIAPIMHALHRKQKQGALISYRLIHTGQHYDKALSDTFFDELSIPHPDANLEVGSGTQAVQTANIMIRFEEELVANPADVVLVVGDINSTMACSLVTKKLNTSLVHVEAGIRSFDMTMPEEVNRLVTDVLADHFFTTTRIANKNLEEVRVSSDRIHFVGNTMIDSLYANQDKFKKPLVWETRKLTEKNYFLTTLHRPSNVDDIPALERIVKEITTTSRGLPVIFPVHPRTAANLKNLKLESSNIFPIQPLGYLEFMYLVRNAKAVITDSGGIQEETTVLRVPCITLRKNSERPETMLVGTNELVPDIKDLAKWMNVLFEGKWKRGTIPELWDGKTSDRIVDTLCRLYP
jgi:UDP-N-acetylglucosamine 2-epimerase (non-hydrolysing)